MEPRRHGCEGREHLRCPHEAGRGHAGKAAGEVVAQDAAWPGARVGPNAAAALHHRPQRRTDVVPDVDIGEVLQLLEEYFEDGMIEW